MFLRKRIEREVARQLTEIAVKPEAILPKTYAPLSEIRRGMYQYVYVPWGEVRVWMELRSLNANQIQECGDLALIEVVAKKGTASRSELIELRNTQEALARAVMNSPTWAEFEALVYGHDQVLQEKRKKLAALQEQVQADPALEREFKADMDHLEMFLGYILPENTLLFLTQWALGLDVSEVKRLTRDKLLEAGVWAKRHHGKPHEYFQGAVFTDRDRNEIDQAADWLFWNTYERRAMPQRRKK